MLNNILLALMSFFCLQIGGYFAGHCLRIVFEIVNKSK